MSAPIRTVALVGHSGNTGKLIVPALAAESTINLRVLHRPTSDVSSLPANVQAVAVDFTNVRALTAALKGVDIFVSLLGSGITDDSAFLAQLELVDAAVAANVKLFLPSDLAPIYTAEEVAAVPVIKAKQNVQEKLEASGLRYIILHAASIAEFGLGYPLLGINVRNNTIDIPGESNENIEFNSIPYIAKAYAALLTLPELDSRPSGHLGIVEFTGTGPEIATALKRKHGQSPKVIHTPAAEVTRLFEDAKGSPGALTATLRQSWSHRGIKSHSEMFESSGDKTSLNDFVQSL